MEQVRRAGDLVDYIRVGEIEGFGAQNLRRVQVGRSKTGVLGKGASKVAEYSTAAKHRDHVVDEVAMLEDLCHETRSCQRPHHRTNRNLLPPGNTYRFRACLPPGRREGAEMIRI